MHEGITVLFCNQAEICNLQNSLVQYNFYMYSNLVQYNFCKNCFCSKINTGIFEMHFHCFNY